MPVLSPSVSLLPFRGREPVVHPSVFIADGVRIVGDVEIGRDCSVWFNSVIRGDVNAIRIGERTNIQDLCMLHVTYRRHSLTVGSNVTVGHSAVLHGATIHDYTLIGMGAKVLDRCVVNSYALVAAGAVLPEGFVVPEGTLVAGVPARVVRDLREEEREAIARSAQNYIDYVAMYRTDGYDYPPEHCT